MRLENSSDPRRRENENSLAGGGCAHRHGEVAKGLAAVGAPQYVVRSLNVILMSRRLSKREHSTSNSCLRRVCAADALAAVGTNATPKASRTSHPPPHSTPVPVR